MYEVVVTILRSVCNYLLSLDALWNEDSSFIEHLQLVVVAALMYSAMVWGVYKAVQMGVKNCLVMGSSVKVRFANIETIKANPDES